MKQIEHRKMEYINDIAKEYSIYINKFEVVTECQSKMNVFLTYNAYDLIDADLSFDEFEYDTIMTSITNHFIEWAEYMIDHHKANCINMMVSLKHMRDYITMKQKVLVTSRSKTITYSRRR